MNFSFLYFLRTFPAMYSTSYLSLIKLKIAKAALDVKFRSKFLDAAKTNSQVFEGFIISITSFGISRVFLSRSKQINPNKESLTDAKNILVCSVKYLKCCSYLLVRDDKVRLLKSKG